MSTHTIRLRGPWRMTVAAPGADASERSLTIDAAAPHETPGFAARLRHSTRLQRRFQRPTGLEPTTRVELHVASLPADVTVVLNGEPLGRLAGSPGSFDISQRLEFTNQLELVLAALPEDSPAEAWPIDVRLTITPA